MGLNCLMHLWNEINQRQQQHRCVGSVSSLFGRTGFMFLIRQSNKLIVNSDVASEATTSGFSSIYIHYKWNYLFLFGFLPFPIKVNSSSRKVSCRPLHRLEEFRKKHDGKVLCYTVSWQQICVLNRIIWAPNYFHSVYFTLSEGKF